MGKQEILEQVNYKGIRRSIRRILWAFAIMILVCILALYLQQQGILVKAKNGSLSPFWHNLANIAKQAWNCIRSLI